jgi:hypothetical protein
MLSRDEAKTEIVAFDHLVDPPRPKISLYLGSSRFSRASSSGTMGLVGPGKLALQAWPWLIPPPLG